MHAPRDLPLLKTPEGTIFVSHRSRECRVRGEVAHGQVRQMIESRAIWETAVRLNLYAWSDEDLEALIVKRADPVITATARYIVDLRRGLAAGKTC